MKRPALQSSMTDLFCSEFIKFHNYCTIKLSTIDLCRTVNLYEAEEVGMLRIYEYSVASIVRDTAKAKSCVHSLIKLVQKIIENESEEGTVYSVGQGPEMPFEMELFIAVIKEMQNLTELIAEIHAEAVDSYNFFKIICKVISVLLCETDK